MRCLPVPVSHPPFIFFLLCLSISAQCFPSVSARRPPSIFLSSATSIRLPRLGVPRIASASFSSWAEYPSVKLTNRATIEKKSHQASGRRAIEKRLSRSEALSSGHRASGIRTQSHREATVKKKLSSEAIKKRPAAIRHRASGIGHQAAEPSRSNRREATVKKKSSSEAIKKRPAAIRHRASGIRPQSHMRTICKIDYSN